MKTHIKIKIIIGHDIAQRGGAWARTWAANIVQKIKLIMWSGWMVNTYDLRSQPLGSVSRNTGIQIVLERRVSEAGRRSVGAD